MIQYLLNIFYKVRFRYFKEYCKKITFTNRNLVFSDNFKNLDNFFVVDDSFYNDNPVYLSKDTVNITEEGLNIACYRDVQYRKSNRDGLSLWTSGMIHSADKFSHSMGVWVFVCNTPDSWPAIWLLKKDREVPNHTKKAITPEIDIMEVINHKTEVNIHWGYTDDESYRKFKSGFKGFKADNQFHEFAVEFLPNGYRFYTDGIVTALFTSSDPEFVSKDENHVIINNAGGAQKVDRTNFTVKSMRVYK